MMDVVRLDLDSPEWGSFVDSHPAATAFHHPAWAKLLAECYGYEPFALALRGARGSLIAGMPAMGVHSWLTGRRIVSLPFTDCCPPLVADDAALMSLTQTLTASLGKPGMPRLEVRAPLPAVPGVYTSSNAVGHTLALLPDPEAVFRGFRKKQVRQSICKAERDGVAVVRGDTRADLDIFYRLHLETRRRLGVPVQPKRFFNLLWQRLIEAGLGFLLVAYVGDAPAASAVFLAWHGVLIYKYSAWDPACRREKPNNLVLWRAIQWGCENGCHTLDLGRSDLLDEGLRAFKSGWGAAEEPLVYSTIACKPPHRPGRRAQQALSLVIHRSPPLVCRTIGELLYGHLG